MHLAQLKVGAPAVHQGARRRVHPGHGAPAARRGGPRLARRPACASACRRARDLRVGAFARGEIVLARRDAVAVPTSALVFGQDGVSVHVVRDDKVEVRPVKTGIVAGGYAEIASGLAEGEPVVARAAGFLRQGDAVRVDPARRGRRRRRPRPPRRRSPVMALNVSAWSIRKPIPSIVALLGADDPRAWSASVTLPITRFPNIDIPIVSVLGHPVGRGAVRAGDAGDQEGRERRRRRERRQAHHLDRHRRHFDRPRSSSASDGEQRPRAQRREGRRSPRIRTDLPRTIDEPIISASTSPACRSSPMRPRRRRSRSSSCPGSSTTSSRASCRAVKGVGKVERIGGVDREIRVVARSRPAAGARRHRGGRQRAAARHQCRSRRRPRRGRRPRAVDPHAGGRAHACEDLAAHRRSRCPAAARSGSTISATVTDGAAEPRTFARLNGEPVVAFAVSRAKGASDVDRRRAGRQAASTSSQAAHPGGEARPRSTPTSTYDARQLSLRPWRR